MKYQRITFALHHFTDTPFMQRFMHNPICSNALPIEYVLLTIININVMLSGK